MLKIEINLEGRGHFLLSV